MTFSILSVLYYYTIKFMIEFAIFLAIFGISCSLLLENTVKRILSLSIAQIGIILFFIIIAYNVDGHPPVENITTLYSHPLPHTLMLTAIVVSTATTFLLISLAHE